jgi:hypothetical protein
VLDWVCLMGREGGGMPIGSRPISGGVEAFSFHMIVSRSDLTRFVVRTAGRAVEINRLVPETEEEKALFQEVSAPLATCASIFDICFHLGQSMVQMRVQGDATR